MSLDAHINHIPKGPRAVLEALERLVHDDEADLWRHLGAVVARIEANVEGPVPVTVVAADHEEQ